MAAYYNIGGTLRKNTIKLGFVNKDGILKQLIQVWVDIGGTKYKAAGAHLWAAGGNLGTARRSLGGCGTQTAGLSFGGVILSVTDTTEEYNGAAWAAGGNLSIARTGLAGAGTQTAGLSFGGYDGDNHSTTEEYTIF